jgi:uncharacterized RDD family membrane protein YckC
MSSQSSEFSRAGFFRRLAAMIYDSLIAIAIGVCAGLVAVTVLVVLLENGVLDKQGMEHSGDTIRQSLWMNIAIQLWCAAWISSFFMWFWKRGGQTIGMRAWRIRIFSTIEQPMGYSRVCWRMLASLLGLGTLLVLFDVKNKQSLQDRLAKTEVLVLTKEANHHQNW